MILWSSKIDNYMSGLLQPGGRRVWCQLLGKFHHIVDSYAYKDSYKCIIPQQFWLTRLSHTKQSTTTFKQEFMTSHCFPFTSQLIVRCCLFKYTNLIYKSYQPLWHVYLIRGKILAKLRDRPQGEHAPLDFDRSVNPITTRGTQHAQHSQGLNNGENLGATASMAGRIWRLLYKYSKFSLRYSNMNMR